MSYTEEISNLWQNSSNRDLASLLKDLIVLLDKAKAEGEDIPLSIECEIVLNANYAIGFGGTPAETRSLADLFYRITDTINQKKESSSPDSVLNEISISYDHYHRLGCTVASASINILTSDEFHQEQTAYDILSWMEDRLSASSICAELVFVLAEGLAYGNPSSWQLELFTFVLSLKLLYQDLTKTDLADLDDGVVDRKLNSYISSIDHTSNTWKKWQDEWVEKSDYYRFVTLLLTQTTVSEDYWIEQVKSLM